MNPYSAKKVLLFQLKSKKILKDSIYEEKIEYHTKEIVKLHEQRDRELHPILEQIKRLEDELEELRKQKRSPVN